MIADNVKAKSPSPQSFYILLAAILVLFVCLRLSFVTFNYSLSSDQGIAFLATYRLFINRTLTLIGPISSFIVDGRSFFYGPITYYFALPFLLLSHWQPLILNYVLIIVQLACLLFMVRTLMRFNNGKLLALFFAFLFAVTPAFVTSINYWNPHLTIPLATLTTVYLLRIIYLDRRGFWEYCLLGFFSGLGMQSHYGFIFAIGIILFELIRHKKFCLWPLVFGFAVGFTPIILFEFRHHFYNSLTLLSYLTKHSQNYSFRTYHIYSMFPYVLWKASQGFVRLAKKSFFLSFLGFGLYLGIAGMFIVQLQRNYFTTHHVLDFATMTKAANIIKNEPETDFNLIDLATGDTRAMALRYLLTTNGYPPQTEEEYPDARYLYIYSSLPIDEILQGSLWEMDVNRPLILTGSWTLNSKLQLYKLKKIAVQP